jgi:hypothetical protein
MARETTDMHEAYPGASGFADAKLLRVPERNPARETTDMHEAYPGASGFADAKLLRARGVQGRYLRVRLPR